MKKKHLILLAVFLISASGNKLRPEQKKNLRIPEPSDICIASGGGYFIVSDNGILFKTNDLFEVEKEAPLKGFDYEGVYSDDSTVYVSDESLRQIVMYDAKTLELKGVKTFTYSGGRNLGIESITYDAAIGRYVSFTEKNPCLLIQFDKNFSIVDERPIDGIREVSAITYHNHSIWVLSDEEMKIYKLNPSTFSIEAKWSVPVLNPEGICFSKDGKLWIMSDDQEAVFLIPTIE